DLRSVRSHGRGDGGAATVDRERRLRRPPPRRASAPSLSEQNELPILANTVVQPNQRTSRATLRDHSTAAVVKTPRWSVTMVFVPRTSTGQRSVSAGALVIGAGMRRIGAAGQSPPSSECT